MCGSDRNKSTPSNRPRSLSAAAVRFNIVSRSIKGSEPGPLPTRPGHIALCNLGKLFMVSFLIWGTEGCRRGLVGAGLSANAPRAPRRDLDPRTQVLYFQSWSQFLDFAAGEFDLPLDRYEPPTVGRSSLSL